MPVGVVDTRQAAAGARVDGERLEPDARSAPVPRRRHHRRRGAAHDGMEHQDPSVLSRLIRPVQAGITGLLKKIGQDKQISGQGFQDLMKFNRQMLLPFRIISAAFFQESYKKGHVVLTDSQAREFEAFVGKLDRFGLVSLCAVMISDLLDAGVKQYFMSPESADSFEDMLLLMLAEFVRRVGKQSEEKKALSKAAKGRMILGKSQVEHQQAWQARSGEVDKMLGLAQNLLNQMQMTSQQSLRQW